VSIEATDNSPPLEGWQAQPDGVVLVVWQAGGARGQADEIFVFNSPLLPHIKSKNLL